ncbi:MAG: hypothetical protein WCW36_01030 [Candidatus Paceibacterota bacterium]|jgi:hypothetical protein
MVTKKTWDKLLKELERFGNALNACRKVGIDPSTYHRQRKKDPGFRKQSDEATRFGHINIGDFSEGALLKKVGEGDLGAIKYSLTYRHPHYRIQTRKVIIQHSQEEKLPKDKELQRKEWDNISNAYRDIGEVLRVITDEDDSLTEEERRSLNMTKLFMSGIRFRDFSEKSKPTSNEQELIPSSTEDSTSDSDMHSEVPRVSQTT